MTENSIQVNGFCRCCHACGTYKSLGVPYVVENREEIYGIMLRETLGILISPQTGENSASTYTICESCIISLQDAAKFKQQVLTCENNFTKIVIENLVIKSEYAEEAVKLEQAFGLNEKGAVSKTSTVNKPIKSMVAVTIKGEGRKKRKKARRSSRLDSRGIDNIEQETPGLDSDTEWAAPLDYIQEDAAENPKTDTRDVPCTICNKKFSHAGLGRHMNTHTDPRVPTCHICQDKFINGREVIEHIRVSHQIDESYPCNICSDVFDAPELLKKHLTDHYNNELVKCNDCGREYKRQRLQEHIRTHTERFTCDVCNKRYVGKHSLILHMRTHANKKPYICDICGQSFTLESSIKLHLLRIHSDVKPYGCKFCPKRFATKYTRDLHERQHTGMKPFICHICKKTFATNAVLTNHIKSHNEDKPYSCSLCGEQFKHTYTLKQHEIRHTREKQYSCEVCSKRFGYKGNLRVHMRIHTKELPHTCHICKEQFRAKNYLDRHLKKHTGEKYTCKICNKQVTGIYGHMKRHRDRGEHVTRGEHATRGSEHTHVGGEHQTSAGEHGTHFRQQTNVSLGEIH